MAMIGGRGIDAFAENIFNFAALDVVEQRGGAAVS
jgi:hypothetical protein